MLELNRFKERKLYQYSEAIDRRLNALQAKKCRLDKIVYCSLEQNNCGFGCHLHTVSVALLISYYWDRTLVYAKMKVPGMERFEEIFLPIAKNCRLHTMDNETSEFIFFCAFFFLVLN